MSLIRKFMVGRYGTDHLSLLLMGVYLILYFVGLATGLQVVTYLALPVLAFSLWRTLSRNVARRRAENSRFLGLLAPLVRRVRTARAIRKDREHCYFKCPGCGQRLRVPKGKGKISVTCRACGACFEEKS